MAPTVRDRTLEFQKTFKTFKELKGISNKSLKNNNKKNTSLNPKFVKKCKRIHELASTINEEILSVKDKIKELLRLSKSTSNFKDERPQIQKITFSIKLDIDRLKTDIPALEESIKQTFKYNKDNNSAHHYTMLDIIKQRFSSLAKKFTKACMESTKSLKKQKEQSDKFGGNRGNVFRKVPRNRLPRSNNNSNSNNNSENVPLLAPQKQSQLLLHSESDYNEQKAMEAENIEKSLTEISSMMNQFAEILDDQRNTIIHINEELDDATDNIEGAIEQLQKYLASLTGNRWLMIKVFAILIFFAIIFTLFVA